MLNDEIIELEKIKDKNLLILGIGAIGSITIELLARAGFNNFTLVDNDIVEKSNLIRQLSYTNNDILKYKVGVMEKRLKIAFVCVHNSCRSQIAEALGKKLMNDKYEFYS